MTSADRVDLFVIGAGSGGVRAARIAAGHGATVMVAEDHRIGGTCVVRGCVPKKLLVYASRFADDFADAAGFGWTVGASRFDWPDLVAAKEKEVSRLSAIYRSNLVASGAELVENRARLDGDHRVVLADGRTIEADHIVVATGARPDLFPEIPGLEHAITSNEIFDLPVFPRRLLIVGSGYIAVEFASIFARLGAEVTQVFRAEKVLNGFDDDMRDGIGHVLSDAGVVLRPRLLPTAMTAATGGGVEVFFADGRVATFDQVLLATGRRPATRDLGLETAGVTLDAKGAVVVDAYARSSVPWVYAIGDVTNRINLTPVAIREGHALADTLFGGKPTAVSHRGVASAVFTTPELGSVGTTEAEARATYDVVDIYKTRFRPLKATLSGRQDHMLFKLVVDGTTDTVLGAHILAHDAGEMIQMVAIALQMGATKADFDKTVAVHPTMAEELVTLRTRTERHVRAIGPHPARRM